MYKIPPSPLFAPTSTRFYLARVPSPSLMRSATVPKLSQISDGGAVAPEPSTFAGG